MIGIKAIGTYLPEVRTSNFDRMKKFDMTESFVKHKIGFTDVAIKAPEHETSDLCVKAWEDLQENHPVNPENIDCVIVCTQNPDGNGLPHTSAILHEKLSLPLSCAVFDISLGCSGYVYGLSVIKSFMEENEFKCGLLFTADPYSKVLNNDDKKTPYYPLKTDQTDLNDFTGRVIGGKESRIDQVISSQELYEKGLLQRDLSQADEELFVGASIPRLPVYPFNKVNYTESGHLFELDDSPGNERVSLGHRSGTYFEYNANGDAERRVVNDNYTVICGNDTLYVGGKVNIKVLGDATLNVGGDLKASVTGKSKIDSGDSLTVVAPEISLQGTVVKLNS